MKQFVSKRMGLILFALTLIVGSSAIAQAPAGGNGQRGPAPTAPSVKQVKTMIKNVTKELSLNEEQETKVSEIYTAHFDEVRDAMEAGRPDKEKMETMKSTFEKDVKAVLTEDQQKQFTTYIKKNYPGPGNQRPEK